MAAESSRPLSRLTRRSATTALRLVLVVDSSRPASARRIGTPAFINVYSWRENSMTSTSLIGGWNICRSASGTARSPPAKPPAAARISIGVTPVLRR